MKKIMSVLIISVMSVSLVACGNSKETAETAPTEIITIESEESVEESTIDVIYDTIEMTDDIDYAVLSEILDLLGKDDTETHSILGNGEENWSSDKQFFIGRIYQVTLFGENVPVYTSCNANKKVEAVSIRLSDENRTVSEEEVNSWVSRITDFSGVEASEPFVSSESGSKNWKWKTPETIISLREMGNILTLSMNLAVGELK